LGRRVACSLKLDVGCGSAPHDGYTGIDRKLGGEAFPLKLNDGTPVADDSVEEIYASHVLEHFPHVTTVAVLKEWARALKPGGWIKVAVPDFEYIAKNYLGGSDLPLQAYAMGGQTDSDDFHSAIFDREGLSFALRAAGLVDVTAWKSTNGDCSSLPVSLNLCARKLPPLPTIKVAGVFSAPRLVFSDFTDCVTAAVYALGIPVVRTGGAYWGQCIERAMTQKAAEGCEWLLTFDYDSVFTVDHVTALLRLAAEHPEADAIAALEMARGRGGSKPMLVIRDGSSPNGAIQTKIQRAELSEPLTKVQTAHFGLTMIRTAALSDLPHPWFHSAPNPDGLWEDGRVDDDIYFWRHFEEHGKQLFVANRVAIGHAELMVTWPDQNFNPLHQYPTDFHEHGIPERAWQ